MLVGANVLGVLVVLAVLELGLALAIRFPPPSKLFRDTIDDWYTHWERNIVQYDPACARYDAELTYTLRPGRCRFANREFDVELAVSTLGVRDAEEAGVAPEIVVLGDSFSMGWGVPQDRAFPQVMARLSGRKVMNAGVSSYGTIRELALLRRIDTSALTHIVVQYSANDEPENHFAAQHDGQLEVMSEAEYDRISEDHRRRISYYFGKYVRRFLPLLATHVRGAQRPATTSPDEAGAAEMDSFLRALAAARVDFSRVRVVVFELNGHARLDDEFTRRLRTRPHPSNLRTLDVSSLLSPDDYFFYDDHLNERGHGKIARALLPLLTGPHPR